MTTVTAMDDSDAKPTQERDVLEDPEWDLEPLMTPRLRMTPPSYSDQAKVGILWVLGGIGIAAALVGLHWLLHHFI